MDIADDSVDGLVIQTEQRTKDYVRAQQDLARAGMSAMQTQIEADASYTPTVLTSPGIGGGGTTTNRNVYLGGVSLYINQQPGEDADALVDRVMERLNVLCEQGGAAFG